MTRPHPATVVAVVLITVGVVGALATLGATLPSWGPAFLAGAASSAFVSFRVGQYARGYAHARGIRRSHWNAIRGGHR